MALGLLVFGGEEEGAGIGGPGDGADAFGGVSEVLAGGEVADVQGVLAEAGVVGRVSEQVVVGADGHGAHGHEGLAFSKFVDVEEDFFGGVWSCLAAAVDRILQAFDGAGGVEPAAVGVRDGLVGFLDVRKHLGVEGRLELVGRCHGGGGVGVFGGEVGEQLGGGFVAHPGVIVG